MTRSERDRKDLASLAGMFFSSERAPAVVPEPVPGQAREPAVEVIAVTSCGEPAVAAVLALALAGTPSPAGPAVVLTLDDDSAKSPSIDAAALRRLASGGGRAIVLLPPRDVPATRAVSFAAARHVLWIGPGDDAAAQVRTLLRALDLGGSRAVVGCVGSRALGATATATFARDWAGLAPERRPEWLGTWDPGLALPDALVAFAGRPVPVPPGGLEWACRLLR